MIYIIRIDLILKPFFTQLMLSKNINKLTFTSILFKHNNVHLYVHNNTEFFRLNKTITIVPREHNYALKKRLVNLFDHDSHVLINNNIVFDFLLKTLHDADSYKDWNPLYKIANREENQRWLSPSYYDSVNNVVLDLPEMLQNKVCDFNI